MIVGIGSPHNGGHCLQCGVGKGVFLQKIIERTPVFIMTILDFRHIEGNSI